MSLPSPEQIALVVSLLPPTAEEDDGWSQAKVVQVMDDNGYTVAQTVRFYWLERVNETVQYMTIGDKALIQLHQNAKAMLAYWDAVIAANADGVQASPEGSYITFGEIEGPRG